MRNRNLLKDQGGFTLIEIIAVLVILGILAAVAVPKFFDLQEKAREKAIYTAVSEMKVRINQYFAQKLLEGKTWSEIWTAAGVLTIGTDLGNDFTITRLELSSEPPSKTVGFLYFEGNYWVDAAKTVSVPIQSVTPQLELPRYVN